MTPAEFGNLVWNLFGIVAIWLSVRLLVVPLFYAEFRSELFDLRRRLFVLMAEGRIPATSPAYLALRAHFNSLLHSAELLAPSTILAFSLAMPTAAVYACESTRDCIDAIADPELRAELIDLHQNSARATRLHLAKMSAFSPLLWIASVIWWVRLRDGRNSVVRGTEATALGLAQPC